MRSNLYSIYNYILLNMSIYSLNSMYNCNSPKHKKKLIFIISCFHNSYFNIYMIKKCYINYLFI